MKIIRDDQLDERIHSFLERKTKQFPELNDNAVHGRAKSSFVGRVHELAAYLPHISNPRQLQQ
ncbi:MAG TPA: hypothetical protein VLF87_02700 [Patescibacteria group bacterium]|nr:hypothetical protein [Patescibacteria group bacterium]